MQTIHHAFFLGLGGVSRCIKKAHLALVIGLFLTLLFFFFHAKGRLNATLGMGESDLLKAVKGLLREQLIQALTVSFLNFPCPTIFIIFVALLLL